jgi:hypothetical protein
VIILGAFVPQDILINIKNMYRFVYKNKRSGATVMSHVKLDREELELVREMHMPTVIKTTQLTANEEMIKPVVYKKPRVTKTKRKKK